MIESAFVLRLCSAPALSLSKGPCLRLHLLCGSLRAPRFGRAPGGSGVGRKDRDVRWEGIFPSEPVREWRYSHYLHRHSSAWSCETWVRRRRPRPVALALPKWHGRLAKKRVRTLRSSRGTGRRKAPNSLIHNGLASSIAAAWWLARGLHIVFARRYVHENWLSEEFRTNRRMPM